MQTVILRGHRQRDLAKLLIDKAPDNCVVTIKPETRSTEQSSKMWAMLSDISRSQPCGRKMTADLWKAVMLNAIGYAVQFEQGLDGGQPFPVGFRSSRLTKAQMSEMIEFMQAWGDQNGVRWSEQYAD